MTEKGKCEKDGESLARKSFHHVSTYRICGELVAELAWASAEMPGNWGRDADADSEVEVELGREMGSMLDCGNARLARAVASSMTDRKEGKSWSASLSKAEAGAESWMAARMAVAAISSRGVVGLSCEGDRRGDLSRCSLPLRCLWVGGRLKSNLFATAIFTCWPKSIVRCCYSCQCAEDRGCGRQSGRSGEAVGG